MNTVSIMNVSKIYIHNIGKHVKPKNSKHMQKIMNENKSSKITAYTKDDKLKIIQIGYTYEEVNFSS